MAERVETNQVVLHQLNKNGKGNKIERNEAEKLWKAGKLVGMFNIPFDNPDLFESCQDFAIQGEENQNWSEELRVMNSKNEALTETNRRILQSLKELKEQNSKLNEKLLIKEEEREKQISHSNLQNQKQLKQIKELEKEISSLSSKFSKQKEEIVKNFEEEREKLINESKKKIEQLRNSMEEEQSFERQKMRDFLEKKFANEKMNWNLERQEEENSIQEELDSTKDIVKELVRQNKDLSKRMKEMKELRDQFADRNRELESHFYSHPATETINRQLLVSFYRSHPETSNETTKLDFFRDHPMSAKLQEDLFEDEDEDW